MVVEIDDATKDQVTQMFEGLDSDVKIHLFIQEHDCLYCNDTGALVSQVAALSKKITVVEHKGALDSPNAVKMGIKMTPAIVLHGKDEYKIRYYGIPAGHEFGALIGSIIDVSTGDVELPEDIVDDIKAIDKPIDIKVFTTPQCPYCPNMVRLANMAAILNPLIEANGIESLEFREMAEKYQVFGVPKTVINESTAVEGLIPPQVFVDKLYEAVGS